MSDVKQVLDRLSPVPARAFARLVFTSWVGWQNWLIEIAQDASLIPDWLDHEQRTFVATLKVCINEFGADTVVAALNAVYEGTIRTPDGPPLASLIPDAPDSRPADGDGRTAGSDTL